MSAAEAAASRLTGWARQGIESFVAAQNILLDLTAQQNALAIGVIRERLGTRRLHPGAVITKMADRGVSTATTAGKILLDLAAGENALAVEGLKEGLRLSARAGAMADLLRDRVDTLVEMQKHVLETAAEQTHRVVEAYQEGKGLDAAGGVVEAVRQSLQAMVKTEKKFLDMAVEQVTIATEAGKEPRKPARDRTKVLAHLAREGVDKFVEAQKKLLDLAITQIETNGKAMMPEGEEEPRTSFAEITQRSVRNIVAAQKSLMDLAIAPLKTPAPVEDHPKPSRRPRHKR